MNYSITNLPPGVKLPDGALKVMIYDHMTLSDKAAILQPVAASEYRVDEFTVILANGARRTVMIPLRWDTTISEWCLTEEAHWIIERAKQPPADDREALANKLDALSKNYETRANEARTVNDEMKFNALAHAYDHAADEVRASAARGKEKGAKDEN